MKYATRLVCCCSLFLALGIGAYAEEPSKAKETTTAFEVKLSNGLFVQAVGYSIQGEFVYLHYPSGARSKFNKVNVDLSSLPPAEISLVPSPQPREELGEKGEDSEWESFESLREAAGSVHLSADHIEIEGTPKPTPSRSPAGPTDRIQQPPDDGSNYMETLIAREEEEHKAALLWYEGQIQQLAQLRSELSRAWNRASAACEGATIVGGQTHGIFANSWESWTLDVRSFGWVDNSTTPTCRAMMADAETLASALVTGLNHMGTLARKNGILPGEARRILGSYGFRS